MSSAGRTLDARLREFVDGHPGGWDHHAWMGLVAELAAEGVDTRDADTIGAALERERVRAVLEGAGVKGLGPKRREALADRFGTLWRLKNASAEEIAEVPAIHAGLAEAVRDALR